MTGKPRVQVILKILDDQGEIGSAFQSRILPGFRRLEPGESSLLVNVDLYKAVVSIAIDACRQIEAELLRRVIANGS
jgi:hypothetical protein